MIFSTLCVKNVSRAERVGAITIFKAHHDFCKAIINLHCALEGMVVT